MTVLAGEPNWVTVECFDAAADAVKSPEEIHRAILAAVEPLVFARASALVATAEYRAPSIG